jgi:N-acetylmuramoyl-L-alanine amidase
MRWPLPSLRSDLSRAPWIAAFGKAPRPVAWAILAATALWLSAAGVAPASARDGARHELQSVQLLGAASSTTTRVQLELGSDLTPKFLLLQRPLRAVLDLPGTRSRPTMSLPAAGGAIRAIRTGPQADGSLRLVLDLEPGSTVNWQQPVQPARRFVIEVKSARSRLSAAAPTAATPTATASTAAASTPAASTVAASAATASAASPPSTLKPIRTEHAPDQGRDVVVAIDAGHGGQDPGAIGRAGLREKDVVLDISRELAARINREPGMRAILTRDGDYFLTLRQRIKRARDAGAQLFVSVHADSVRDRTVSGSSVYVLSLKGATDEQARLLADRENAADLAGGVSLDDKDPMIASVLVDLAQSAQISQSMVAAERVLRSLRRVNDVRKPQVQQAGFVVLKSPDIPSMLVETAFISSPADERLLGQAERREALAEAIFDGVRQYFIDHPPDGSRFARARDAGRTVVATAAETAPPRAGAL